MKNEIEAKLSQDLANQKTYYESEINRLHMQLKNQTKEENSNSTLINRYKSIKIIGKEKNKNMKLISL